MSVKTISFDNQKGFQRNKKRFFCINDFSIAAKSDSELISMLGFDSRFKKGGIKSRAENDYLNCYRVYLDSEINVCKNNNDFYFLDKLSKAYSVLNYIVNQKNSFGDFRRYRNSLTEKQSIMLAKLKTVIRTIIVEYNMSKFGFAIDMVS